MGQMFMGGGRISCDYFSRRVAQRVQKCEWKWKWKKTSGWNNRLLANIHMPLSNVWNG